MPPGGKPPVAPPGQTKAAPQPEMTPEQLRHQRLRNRAILGGTVVGLGGIGAAAYLGSKGIDAAQNVMSEPTHSASHWGPGGFLPPTDVNEFGVPVY